MPSAKQLTQKLDSSFELLTADVREVDAPESWRRIGDCRLNSRRVLASRDRALR